MPGRLASDRAVWTANLLAGASESIAESAPQACLRESSSLVRGQARPGVLAAVLENQAVSQPAESLRRRIVGKFLLPQVAGRTLSDGSGIRAGSRLLMAIRVRVDWLVAQSIRELR